MTHKLVLLCFTLPTFGFGQSGPIPQGMAVVRDDAALAAIRTSLSAMNPENRPAINTWQASWVVTSWAGHPEQGKLQEEASIGGYRSTDMTLNDGSSFKYKHIGMKGFRQTLKGTSKIGDERNLESLAFTPVFLLRDLLENTKDTVEPKRQSSNAQECIQATLRDSRWLPRMGAVATTGITICFDTATHLITTTSLQARSDYNLTRTSPEEITFEGYTSVQGWLLPQAETVRLAYHVMLQLSSANQVINVPVNVGNMPVQ